MKTLLSGMPLLAGVLLTGCASTEFYALSDSAGKEGGITLVRRWDAPEQNLFTPLRTVNYLIRDPASGLFYGTVSRLSPKEGGGVATLRADGSGKLELLALTPVNGNVPCHLTLSPDGQFLYTANYSSASITELPLKEGIPQRGRVVEHPGKGTTKRQEKAHPHFAGFDRAGRMLAVADLGLDQIRLYPWAPGRGIAPESVEIIRLHPGAGPRHLVFSPDGRTLHVANELDNTVSSFVLRNGKWAHAQTIRPMKETPKTRSYPGAIRMTGDGAFVFVSNRGHNSIAVIETGADGAMKLIDTVGCNGDFPRDIALSPDETILIAANEKSGTVTRFSFDRKEKKLSPEKEALPIPKALCILFR